MNEAYPLITCILPVYNCEEFLERSLIALLRQELTQWEAICVNDGSSDKSLEILNKYAALDERFIVINNENNIGAAESRNIGLDRANGKYVIFLDSDDYYYPTMLSELFVKAENNHADLVIYGIEFLYCADIDGHKKGEIVPVSVRNKIVINNNKELFDILNVKTLTTNKLIRLDLMKRNDIKFQNLPTNNDVFFSIAVASVAEKILFYDKILYRYYYGRGGSLTEDRKQKKCHSVIAWSAAYQFICKRLPEIKYQFLNAIVSSFYDELKNNHSEAVLSDVREQILNQKEIIDTVLNEDNIEFIHYASRLFIKRIINGERIYSFENKTDITRMAIKLIFEEHGNKGITLWGCGVKGTRIIEVANDEGLRFSHVVDIDSKKHGSNYSSYIIEDYMRIKDKVSLIVLSNPSFYSDVKKIVQDKILIMI